ncbi:MAG: hypothetical protein AAF466_01630 [Bacteroidota bacterium]
MTLRLFFWWTLFIWGTGSFQLLNAQTVFRGVVMDATTKKPVPFAKVGVTGQGVGVLSDENGRFVYRKYHQIIDGTSKLEVSAGLYQSLEMPGDELRTVLNKTATIYLQPDEGLETSYIQPKNIHVIWDASLASSERSSDTELEFLQHFIQNTSWEQMRFTIFNETVQLDKNVETKQEAIELLDLLKTVEYRGASDYHIVPKTNADALFLFAESAPTFGELKVRQEVPVHVFNSTDKAGLDPYFEKLTSYTSGLCLNLKQLTREATLEAILTGVSPDVSVTSASERIITGSIVSESGPIAYATLSKEGSLDETYSKEDGRFSLIAQTDDTFTVRAIGHFNKQFTVTGAGHYEINMVPSAEMLEEVAVTAVRNRYNFNPNKSTDVFEGKDVAVRSLGPDELNKYATNAFELINGKFGVVSNGQVTFVKGLEAEWVVDGVVMSPSQVSPKNIIRISVHRPETNILNIRTARPRAKIIVTTKFHPDHIDAELRRLGYAPQENNTYDEQLELISEQPLAGSYLNRLSEVDDLEGKWEIYQSLRERHADKVAFYVDLSLYFQSLDIGLASKVRSDFAVVAKNNPKALRVLAYLHEHAGSFLEARNVYERILILEPGMAGSYRDLARSYQDTGEYQKALELYINMLGNEIKGVDFEGLEKTISNELQRLVSVHKSKISFDRLPFDWLRADFNIDIRMTIEWSSPGVPFEFQSVNPDNRYFNWNSENRIASRQNSEVLVEEFLVDNAPKGNWIVNVKYTGIPGDASVTPYLKYTLYKNYGTPNESKTIKLVKLEDQLEKVTLDTFLN